jgi:hypothetical protein
MKEYINYGDYLKTLLDNPRKYEYGFDFDTYNVLDDTTLKKLLTILKDKNLKISDDIDVGDGDVEKPFESVPEVTL